jgi:hypothetical protein
LESFEHQRQEVFPGREDKVVQQGFDMMEELASFSQFLADQAICFIAQSGFSVMRSIPSHPALPADFPHATASLLIDHLKKSLCIAPPIMPLHLLLVFQKRSALREKYRKCPHCCIFHFVLRVLTSPGVGKYVGRCFDFLDQSIYL